MTSTFPVPLAPSNLARHPVFWSSAEVKAWVEFCVQEFSLSPIAFDRFDMNGKAMMLLNRSDFMERAPRVGDVLYNAFTHLSMTGVSGSNYTFNTSVKTPVFLSRDLGSQRASILSPAATDQSVSDTESCHNYTDSPVKSPGEGEGHIDGSEVTPGVGEQRGECRLLWEFIYQLLNQDQNEDLVCWENADSLTFRINDPTGLADQWGSQKNRTNMTYEKLSRALRYYYKMNIIQKVPGKKLTYKFIQSPEKIRKGQRGAKPHSSRSPQRSLLGSCSDNNDMTNNNDAVAMETKDDSASSKTTLAPGADKKASVKDSNNTPSPSTPATLSRDSPVVKTSEEEEEEEEKKIVDEHSAKQETRSSCSSEKNSLENQKNDDPNTRDLQTMKYENYEEQLFQDDDAIRLDNMGTHLQPREMKLLSSSSAASPPPVFGALTHDQNQSESPSMLRYSEDDHNPGMDIGMEESDFSEELRPLGLSEIVYDKETMSPETTYFKNESTLKESQDVELKENFNRNPPYSSMRNDLYNVRGHKANSDTSSSISQNNMRSTDPLSVSSYFQDDDSSACCIQEIAKHSHSHPCIAQQVQLNTCSKSLYLMSENQSSSSEPKTSLSRCNAHLSASPTFSSSSISPSIFDQCNKTSNTTSLVSQAFACLNKNINSPSPSGSQYHDLHPRELQQQHYQDLSVSQRHPHIQPAHSRHHLYDYSHIDNTPLHSKPLNLVTGSNIDNKYHADNNNNNNNIPMENPFSYRQYRSHFNDIGPPRLENMQAPNTHKKFCDPGDGSTFLNHRRASSSPGPPSYASLPSPSFDTKMYRHERTSAEDVSKSSVLNTFNNEITVGSCRKDGVNRVLDCCDLPEDLSVKNVHQFDKQ